MKPREIKPGIYAIGAIDWDRRLFDVLIPLPDGTSYNSYLVKGTQKTALVDSVDPAMSNVLMANLDELGIRKIDYIIAHHGEQDHSGSIPLVLQKYPQAKVVVTPRCKTILMDLLMITEDSFITVDDHATISLGERTLEFIHLPWVHWPETMVTYLREDKILFSCDFLGSHLATSDLYVTDEGRVYESAQRYFAEIMMPFRTNIQKNLEKLQSYDIEIIAPSHGPLYNRPEFILKAYHSWVYNEPKNIVLLPFVSMHGSTHAMVNYFISALVQKGVAVKPFDLSVVDIGKLAQSMVDAATVVIGVPAVLGAAHPLAAYAAFLTNALRPNIKFASIIGSFGWGSRLTEQITGMLPNLKVELLPPVLAKGYPKEADLQALDALAITIASKHQEHHYI